MTEIIVRPIASNEIAAAVGVMVGGSGAPQYEEPSDVGAYAGAIDAVRARGGDVLVAVADEEVVGLCQFMVLPHFQHRGGRCGEVESVHVRADWRRRGVGRSLLAAAETLARDAGCYRIQLTSNQSRDAAHEFYPALGYEPTHVGYKKHLDVARP